MHTPHDRLVRALDALQRDVVFKLCQKFGVPLANRRDKLVAIETFAKLVPASDYVSVFMVCDIPKLAKVARALNLNVKAPTKLVLAQRIATFVSGQGNSTPAAQSVNPASPPLASAQKTIFIVHGHEDLMKIEVARELEKLGFNVVILHEQPNRGKTIIEKLETLADMADYAVVLLSPDDMGAAKANVAHLNPRGRQNVVLELGYFLAKLGRHQVSVLYRPTVELPSDINGVVYIEYAPGGIAHVMRELEKELRDAGLL